MHACVWWGQAKAKARLAAKVPVACSVPSSHVLEDGGREKDIEVTEEETGSSTTVN